MESLLCGNQIRKNSHRQLSKKAAVKRFDGRAGTRSLLSQLKNWLANCLKTRTKTMVFDDRMCECRTSIDERIFVPKHLPIKGSFRQERTEQTQLVNKSKLASLFGVSVRTILNRNFLSIAILHAKVTLVAKTASACHNLRFQTFRTKTHFDET